LFIASNQLNEGLKLIIVIHAKFLSHKEKRFSFSFMPAHVCKHVCAVPLIKTVDRHVEEIPQRRAKRGGTYFPSLAF
jgi:hypothetical protein